MTQIAGKQVSDEQGQDRSMARLAEILEAVGVEVLKAEEGECCRPPRLHFERNGIPLRDIEALVVDSGYQIARIHSDTIEYEEEKTGLPWTYKTLEF